MSNTFGTWRTFPSWIIIIFKHLQDHNSLKFRIHRFLETCCEVDTSQFVDSYLCFSVGHHLIRPLPCRICSFPSARFQWKCSWGETSGNGGKSFQPVMNIHSFTFLSLGSWKSTQILYFGTSNFWCKVLQRILTFLWFIFREIVDSIWQVSRCSLENDSLSCKGTTLLIHNNPQYNSTFWFLSRYFPIGKGFSYYKGGYFPLWSLRFWSYY